MEGKYYVRMKSSLTGHVLNLILLLKDNAPCTVAGHCINGTVEEPMQRYTPIQGIESRKSLKQHTANDITFFCRSFAEINIFNL